MEMENAEVLSPPPYPAHLPSYDEILRLLSPMPSQLCNEEARPNLQQSSQEVLVWIHSWPPHSTTDFGSTLSLPAPPAYEDIMQYRVVEGEPCDPSDSVQQLAETNVQQNQTDVEMSESDRELQQHIERRMAAIDEEIRQRRAQRMLRRRRNVQPSAGNKRVLDIVQRFNPARVMVYLKKQSTVHP